MVSRWAAAKPYTPRLLQEKKEHRRTESKVWDEWDDSKRVWREKKGMEGQRSDEMEEKWRRRPIRKAKNMYMENSGADRMAYMTMIKTAI